MSLLLRSRLPLADQIHFWQALLMLLQSGMNVLQAIQGLQRSPLNPTLTSILAYLEQQLHKGRSLSQALEPFVPSLFDHLTWQMLRIGEQSGQLEQVVSSILSLKQRRASLLQHLQQAATYPLLTLSVGLIIIILLITIVLPEFQKFYHSFGNNLPLLTRILMGLGDFIMHYGWLLGLAVIGSIITLIQAVRYQTSVHYYWYQLLLHIPFIGSILYYQNFANCWRHLQLLIKAGLPLNQALDAVIPALMIPQYQVLLQVASQHIQTGQPLSTALYKTQVLSPFLYYMLTMGEQTGRLDRALDQMAQHCDKILNQYLHSLQHSLGPAIMLVLSLIVGLILVGMYLPMFTMGQVL